MGILRSGLAKGMFKINCAITSTLSPCSFCHNNATYANKVSQVHQGHQSIKKHSGQVLMGVHGLFLPLGGKNNNNNPM